MSQCSRRPDARAIIRGSEDYPDISGEVFFCQGKNAVIVTVRISGLPENDSGFYGFHIHEGNDCENGFRNTGGHLNLKNQPHPEHMGDLPPLLCCNGNAFMTVRTNRFRVCDIVGRTVVIHSMADDFRTQPSGDSGEKIACGTICRNKN